jgi:hypothetical protein
MKIKQCLCGSGLARYAEYDARGIFLTFVCDACVAEKLKEFRPDVLVNPDYWSSEPIEEEE